MARRRTPSRKKFEQYQNAYARTSDTWTTRYYNRKTDPMFDLRGLDTVSDDFHKPDGSSPFLRNVRYMGEREEEQRAQVMSRKGAKPLAFMGEDEFNRSVQEGDTYVTLQEGQARQWEFTHNKRLTGVSFYAYNPDNATGYIKVSVRNPETSVELAQAVINVSEVSMIGFSQHKVHFISTVIPSRLVARIEILDDVDNSEVTETNTAPETRSRRVRILATRAGKHERADYGVPNVDESLEEIPYTFVEDNGLPVMGTLINDWKPMLRGKEFRYNGRDHLMFPVKHEGVVEIYRQDLITNQVTFVTGLVNSSAKQVRFAQAEGYMYYVDGISPLRRINLTTLAAENVVPKASDIQGGGSVDSVKPKDGASLIHFLSNRIYLSGFNDDPNLVIVSLIDAVKPRFEQYSDRFYSPDQAPQLSAGNKITAIADMSGLLVIFREKDLSLYTSGSGYEAGGASQITPEGAALGVLNQEAVCQSQNNIYFFNPIEGVVRFGGSLNRGVSLNIENLQKRIKHPESIFMAYHNRRVRMFFSYNSTENDSCLYYYTDLEGKLPWYHDINTPVLWAVPNKKTDEVFAMHSQVATTMSLERQFTDFDSYIEMIYHTQYRLPDNPSGEVFVRRIHLHEFANTTHSVFIGIDKDSEDQPTVYRRYVSATQKPVVNPDAIFAQSAEQGISVVSIGMYLRCRRYQVRIKRYCYKDLAEVLGVVAEYGSKDPI